MSNEYTPPTDRVRAGYTEGIREIGSDEQFDRWLAGEREKTRRDYAERIIERLVHEADKADTSTARTLHLVAADLVRAAAVSISLEASSNG